MWRAGLLTWIITFPRHAFEVWMWTPRPIDRRSARGRSWASRPARRCFISVAACSAVTAEVVESWVQDHGQDIGLNVLFCALADLPPKTSCVFEALMKHVLHRVRRGRRVHGSLDGLRTDQRASGIGTGAEASQMSISKRIHPPARARWSNRFDGASPR